MSVTETILRENAADRFRYENSPSWMSEPRPAAQLTPTAPSPRIHGSSTSTESLERPEDSPSP